MMENKDISILQELLKIQIERLKLAVETEKQNKIVFPETSSIVKSILSIEAEINLRTAVKDIKENPLNEKGNSFLED